MYSDVKDIYAVTDIIYDAATKTCSCSKLMLIVLIMYEARLQFVTDRQSVSEVILIR